MTKDWCPKAGDGLHSFSDYTYWGPRHPKCSLCGFEDESRTLGERKMIFRMRYKVLGCHTHVRVFAGETDHVLSKCGDLVFRNEEWTLLLPILARQIQVMEEEHG